LLGGELLEDRLDVGFAAAAPAGAPLADVPGAADVPGDADGPAEAGADEGAAAPVTLAACLEPKMADTMLPKMLIVSSCLWLLAPLPPISSLGSCPISKMPRCPAPDSFEPGDANMQARALPDRVPDCSRSRAVIRLSNG
jgi:hypothetical protein